MRERSPENPKQPEPRCAQPPQQRAPRRPLPTLVDENPLICRGLD